MRNWRGYFIGILIGMSATAYGDGARLTPILDSTYNGTHSAEFATQFDRVRLLTHQAQLEVSARLGLLRYRDGFRYPLKVRFVDDVPAGLENALAYVRLGYAPGAGFQQELVVNLSLASRASDFDTVFYHEMTHAVLNDAVGGEAAQRIPAWLQEGLALYVSSDGDSRVRKAAEALYKSQAQHLVFNLDGPVQAAAYPQYYLAVKYILDTYSVNAVQGLVRNLTEGRDLESAFQDVTGTSVAAYKTSLAAYSLRVFRDLAMPDSVNRRHSVNHF